MPKTGQFLSGRFCQISIWFQIGPIKIGTTRVNFGLVGPPGYSLDVCTSGKSRIYMQKSEDKQPILHLLQLPFPWKLLRPVKLSYCCPWFFWTSNHLQIFWGHFLWFPEYVWGCIRGQTAGDDQSEESTSLEHEGWHGRANLMPEDLSCNIGDGHDVWWVGYIIDWKSYAWVETKNGENYIYQGKIVQLAVVGGSSGCTLPCGSECEELS